MRHLIFNPFSEEAQLIVRRYGSIPPRAFDLALSKIVERRSSVSSDILSEVEADILSFYVLLYSVAKFGKNSVEARKVKNIIKDILKERILSEVFGRKKSIGKTISKHEFFIKEIIKEAFNVYDIKEDFRKYVDNPNDYIAIEFREFLDILDKIDITALDIVDGYVLMKLGEFLDIYGIENILDAYLEKIEKRMDEILEKAKDLEFDKKFDKIFEAVSKTIKREYTTKIRMKGGKLNPDRFPPCVKIAMQGVGSGYRNYAVTVLLTSFLSKARLGDKKELSEEDIEILKNEILPIIYEAAERCSPPLFEDQPHEKKNIHYHLGFGLNEEIRLEYFGRSKWYMVPNCEKIKREAPKLCRPDEFCEKIRNPLSYYFRKRKL